MSEVPRVQILRRHLEDSLSRGKYHGILLYLYRIIKRVNHKDILVFFFPIFIAIVPVLGSYYFLPRLAHYPRSGFPQTLVSLLLSSCYTLLLQLLFMLTACPCAKSTETLQCPQRMFRILTAAYLSTWTFCCFLNYCSFVVRNDEVWIL